jgi:hypothetical protein
LKQGKIKQDKSWQNLCPIFYFSELFDGTVFWGEGCGLNKHFSPPVTQDEEWILRMEMLNGWAKFEKQHYRKEHSGAYLLRALPETKPIAGADPKGILS